MKKTHIIVACIVLSACLASVQSCKKDKDKQEELKEQVQSTGNVDQGDEAEIDYDINTTLNVNGTAEFQEPSTVSSDINVNSAGKVVVDLNEDNDLVTVTGNANLNDSLVIRGGNLTINGCLNLNNTGKVLIDDPNSTVTIGGNANINYTVTVKRGTLVINGDLNNNSRGVINCYSTGKVIVRGTLNQNGTAYGYANFTVYGTANLSGNILTVSAPLQ